MARKAKTDTAAGDRRALRKFRETCRCRSKPGELLIKPERLAEDMTKLANLARSIERSTSIDPGSGSHCRAVSRRHKRERVEREAWAEIGQKPPPPSEGWQRYLERGR